MTLPPGLLAALLVALSAWCILQWHLHRPGKRVTSQPSPTDGEKLRAYYDIEPLTDFDWARTEPLQLRPYKPKFHLTMGIEQATLSALLEVDNTYLSRIHHRRHLLAAHAAETAACRPAAEPAARELYAWLFGTYLPRRFPSMYRIESARPTPDPKPPASEAAVAAAAVAASSLRNLVTSELIPLTPPADGLTCLRALGAHIDTEFLLLQPTPAAPPTLGRHRLEGYVNCFPSGFSTRAKLGLLLAEVHGPVPGYAARLERSMDRYFTRFGAGALVRRVNWSVDERGELFAPSGNHFHGEEEARREVERREEREAEGEAGVDVTEAVLRVERQTLHRLPESGAMVFAFKTYTYPVAAVKEEGGGEALAEAIEGIAGGSVPGMAVYKKAVVWGRPVVDFLRS